MKKNQKYIPLLRQRNVLSNYFIVVANISPVDSGKTIIKGNERVINARLEDANFFWNKDLNETSKRKLKKLDNVIFHNKLGSLKQKVDRLKKLSDCLVSIINLKKNKQHFLKEAATMCKNDLVTEVVREFPVLQGVMGYYYAKNEGNNEKLIQACDAR